MTAIVWDDPKDRVYDNGIDRCVLYLPDGSGVAWNGLVSYDETFSDTVTPVYFEGVKIGDSLSAGDWAATLAAYTYPDQFEQFEGLDPIITGYKADNQEVSSYFSLSFRTGVGDGSTYLIHIFYGLTAIPKDAAYNTLSDQISAVNFQWDIEGMPSQVPGFIPTEHYIIDSSECPGALLANIEGQLYGTATTAPALPSLSTLVGLFDPVTDIVGAYV